MPEFPLMPESNLSLFGWLVIKNLKKENRKINDQSELVVHDITDKAV
jgi:hypothetical protein